jgi:O-antigen/teichoic acid export membrane protein
MLRCLGQSEYGLYQLIGSISSYLSLLSFGLSGAYIRFYSVKKAESEYDGINRLNGLYLIVFTIISAVTTIAGIIIAVNISSFFEASMSSQEIHVARLMMLIMTVNVAITLPGNIFTSYISANEKFIFQRVVKLAYAIINPILCIIALSLGGKATALVVVALISTLLMLISEVYYCITKINFRISLKNISRHDFTELFTFSFFIFINDVINQINWGLDKVLLGFFAGTISIAIYGIAAQLNSYFFTLSTTISSVFAPQVNQIETSASTQVEKKKKLDAVFLRVGKVQGYIVFLIITGYILFGKPFIALWAGADYFESYYVGLWLMIPVVIPLMQNIGIEIQRAKNKHKVRSIVYSCMAVLNVIISIPLCKSMGAIGCAIGTAISVVLGNIVFMNWYYHRRLGIDIPGFWLQEIKTLPSLIPPLIVGIVIVNKATINSWGSLLLFIIIYVVAYLVSVYSFAMSKDEKQTVIRLCKRIVK